MGKMFLGALKNSRNSFQLKAGAPRPPANGYNHSYIYIYIHIEWKTLNHEPSKIHTFIFFHLPRHWHCIGTATCEIGPRRTKGLGIWASKGATAHATHPNPHAWEDRNLHQVLRRLMWGKRSRFRRPGDGRHSELHDFFFRPELQCFWPLLNRCAKKWNVGLGKSKYTNQCIFFALIMFFFSERRPSFFLYDRCDVHVKEARLAATLEEWGLGLFWGGGF